jgi:hypothetical protein
MSEQMAYKIEENKIILLATKWFAERELTTFNEKSKDSTIGFLQDKFVELENEVKLLRAEYINAPEKIKLAGKINRTKQYICSAKAIGNYSIILEILDEIEQEIIAEIEANIGSRTAILETAKSLLQSQEDWKTNTEKLTQLSKDFKALPLVPDPRMDEIRVEFEKLKDDFFNKKKGFFEEKESILLDNLAHKMEICEKAEALATSTDWKKTTELLNALTEEWKTVGPIPRHRSDELWMKFNGAKDVFFGKKKEHYEAVKENQGESYKIKLELIEKAEALKDSRDWKKTSDEFNHLMDEWKKTGRLSNEQNEEVWNKFNEIRNVFYSAKDAYYSSIKLNLEDNFAKKSVLVNRAEELATGNISAWQDATEEMMEMMEEWKKIGRVAKEHGDTLWERFIKAKKDFFEKKDADREKRKAEGGSRLDDRMNRNRGFSGKLQRELQLEREVLADFENRLKNIVPGVRSFETQDRYETIIEDAKKKIAYLESKIESVSAGLQKDEKDMRFINREPRQGGDAPKKFNKEFTSRENKSRDNNYASKPKEEQGETALGRKLREDIMKLGAKFTDDKPKKEPKVEAIKAVEPNKEELVTVQVKTTEATIEIIEPNTILELAPDVKVKNEVTSIEAVETKQETPGTSADLIQPSDYEDAPKA